MCGTMFAGQLCATQIGSTFTIDGVDWWVKQIMHTIDQPGPKVIVRSYDDRKVRVLCLSDDDIVTVGDPTNPASAPVCPSTPLGPSESTNTAKEPE
jgi:hypothetical protein